MQQKLQNRNFVKASINLLITFLMSRAPCNTLIQTITRFMRHSTFKLWFTHVVSQFHFHRLNSSGKQDSIN
jgi:hypothetical protein